MGSIHWTEELRLIVAFALGTLIGLERERSRVDGNQPRAGVRTHTLVGLYGFGVAVLWKLGVPPALPIGMASVSLLAGLSYWHKAREGHGGWTSEAAVLLSFLLGVLSLLADVWVAMALAILGTLLLSEKSEIEKRVEHLDRGEFLGMLKFLLVTCIVLPVLPNQEYTTFGINPASTWKIVVMVSSVGFVGYFLIKKLGGRTGLWVSGLVGGVVSSTAVAVATGRIAQRSPEKSGAALQATLLASSVMYVRILVLVWIISPAFAQSMVWKLPLLSAIGVGLAFTVGAQAARDETVGSLQNPFEILPALIFAGVFALFSVLTQFVRQSFGVTGVVLLALLVGAVDIDPFILSVARSSTVDTTLTAAVLLAMMSNTIAKGLYFGAFATTVRRQAWLRYGLWAALHVPLALL